MRYGGMWTRCTESCWNVKSGSNQLYTVHPIFAFSNQHYVILCPLPQLSIYSMNFSAWFLDASVYLRVTQDYTNLSPPHSHISHKQGVNGLPHFRVGVKQSLTPTFHAHTGEWFTFTETLNINVIIFCTKIHVTFPYNQANWRQAYWETPQLSTYAAGEITPATR